MEPLEKRIAARIAQVRGTSLARLGLRFDRVVKEVAADLRAHGEQAVPDGALILATLTAPILQPGKTAAALCTRIDALLAHPGARRDLTASVLGNRVRLRLRVPAPPLGSKVVLFVHNPAVDARTLLDDACDLD